MLNVSKFNAVSAQLVDAQERADNTAYHHAEAVYRAKVALADQKKAASEHAGALNTLKTFVGDVKAELLVVEQFLSRSRRAGVVQKLLALFKR